MSAAAVQQLADVLQAVSSGAVGTFLGSKLGEDAVWENSISLPHYITKPFALLCPLNEHTVNSAHTHAHTHTHTHTHTHVRPVNFILSHNYRSSLSPVTSPHK
jgi:hypothetical protein